MITLDGGRPVIRCNHCRQPIHARYRRQHLQECRDYQAKQKLGRVTHVKNGKPLYALAVQRTTPNGVELEMHYTHAHSPAEARRTFLLGHRGRNDLTIVEVGLAIGMFLGDRDGKILLAD